MNGRLRSLQSLAGLFLALVAIFVAFALKVPNFGGYYSVQKVAQQSATVLLASLGMTFVIVVGGIDLSVGSTAALSGVVVAKLLTLHQPPLVAALAGVAAGLALGALNGTLITRLNVVPFIVTLGTYLSIRGGAKWIAKEQSVYPEASWLNGLLATLDKTERWKLVPIGVWIAVVFAVASALGLRFLRFGRHVVAVGSNESAARLCGVPVERTKLLVYCLSGFFAGLAGLMNFSRLTIGDPTSLVGLELDAIAAVVIGGASLSGGEGSIAGTVLGALIMSVLRTGASQMNLPNYVQEIVTGLIIVLAVWFDRVRKARAALAA